MNGKDNGAAVCDAARLSLTGLLLIQLFLGYEWLMSGLTKIVRGGFASGLADELAEKSEGAGGWYGSFLDEVVIPNAEVFGWLIVAGELVTGIGLAAAGLLWLLRWERLAVSGRTAVLAVTALAALGGIVMNVNFHLANGSAHPWLVPGDGFDEGVDLDSLMPALQLVLIGVSVGALRAVQRERRAASPATGDPATD
jgi:hypothetical protein